MIQPNHNWVVKVLRFITRDEVKTPLSFLFKVVPYLVAALIVILYAPIADGLKATFLLWVFLALLGLSGVVLLFAWFRPKHLVYGETGHRAEHKLEFGTDKHPLSREEYEILEGESDPNQPRIERK